MLLEVYVLFLRITQERHRPVVLRSAWGFPEPHGPWRTKKGIPLFIFLQTSVRLFAFVSIDSTLH